MIDFEAYVVGAVESTAIVDVLVQDTNSLLQFSVQTLNPCDLVQLSLSATGTEL